jgi:hypothetical protein
MRQSNHTAVIGHPSFDVRQRSFAFRGCVEETLALRRRAGRIDTANGSIEGWPFAAGIAATPALLRGRLLRDRFDMSEIPDMSASRRRGGMVRTAQQELLRCAVM